MPVNQLHLRAFHDVASAGSFTRAALARHISQPTLSEQVAALERQYGVTLFSRRGRSISLTPVGQELLDVTTRLVELDQEAEACLRQARELTGGQLRLGADAPVHTMPLLARFLERHPAVGVSLVCGNRGTVLADLLEHRVDAAVVSDVDGDDRLVTRPLVRDRFVAIVHRDDPLAARKRIRVAELLDHRLVVREPGSQTRRILDAALLELGCVATDILEVDSREAAHVAAAMRLGVAVASESELPRDSRVVAIPLTTPQLLSTESVACLATRADTALIRAVFAAARR